MLTGLAAIAARARPASYQPGLMCAVKHRAFWARGALCMAVSTLVMCTSALCVKLIGDRVPLFEIVVRRPAWLRAVCALVLHVCAGLSKGTWVMQVDGLYHATTCACIKYSQDACGVRARPRSLALHLFRAHACMPASQSVI